MPEEEDEVEAPDVSPPLLPPKPNRPILLKEVGGRGNLFVELFCGWKKM